MTENALDDAAATPSVFISYRHDDSITVSNIPHQPREDLCDDHVIRDADKSGSGLDCRH